VIKYTLSLLALLAFIPSVAHAGTVETTAYQVMKATGTRYEVPLQLKGGPGAVLCDSYKNVLPLRTTCMIRENYPHAARCFISLNVRSNGHASGRVICGSVKDQWSWGAKYVWNVKSFVWSGQTHYGSTPW
jgi:hypothetical protein